jgi:hypothetical protein
MHVADQHDQLGILQPGKQARSIPLALLEPERVHTVVNHAQLLGRESVLGDQGIADRRGVGQHHV